MRQGVRSLSLVAVLLCGMALVGGRTAAVAQEATPAAVAPVIEPLGFVAGVPLPSTGDLGVARVHYGPGAVFTNDPSDPIAALFVLESGAVTVWFDTAAWTIVRGGEDGPGATETIAMGEEATLEAGDIAYWPGNTGGAARNDGPEPAEALIFLIAPPEVMPEMVGPADAAAAGTPAP